MAAGRLPEIPVWIDSPMAVEATEVFRRHVEEHDFTEARMEGVAASLVSPWVRMARTAEESKAINGHQGAGIVIASSGMKVTQIPFKGTPEVVAAVLSKSVDAYWGPVSAVIANIRGGKLKALAVSTPKRSSTLPEIPTLEEAGIKNAASPLWFGMWVPSGTPNEVVQKISRDTLKVLSEPTIAKRLTDLGNDLMLMNPQEFSRYVDAEILDYDRVIRSAGIEKR